MPMVTAGYVAPGFKLKSFPVPRKLFDCFTAVVHASEPLAGAVAGKVKVTLPPGGTRSADEALTSWIVVAFGGLSFVPVQFRAVDGLANEKEVFPVLKVGTDQPVGILICAEPNPCPPGGMLFVSVKDRFDVEPAVRQVGLIVGV